MLTLSSHAFSAPTRTHGGHDLLFSFSFSFFFKKKSLKHIEYSYESWIYHLPLTTSSYLIAFLKKKSASASIHRSVNLTYS